MPNQFSKNEHLAILLILPAKIQKIRRCRKQKTPDTFDFYRESSGLIRINRDKSGLIMNYIGPEGEFSDLRYEVRRIFVRFEGN